MSEERRRASKRAKWRRRLTVLAFMSPWLVGFTVFFGYPLVSTVYLSFTATSEGIAAYATGREVKESH